VGHRHVVRATETFHAHTQRSEYVRANAAIIFATVSRVFVRTAGELICGGGEMKGVENPPTTRKLPKI